MGTASSIYTVITSLALPIAAAIWLSLKKKGYLKPILLGAATFLVFQTALRLPLIQYVFSPMPWFITMGITSPFLTALFYGSTAALFEEGGRFIVMKLFMKNSLRISDGIAFGIGHGGIEAILLVGINTLVSLAATGGSATPGLEFAAGSERLFTIAIHLALSVMVLKAVAEKKPLWLLLAFILHTVIDTGTVLAQEYGTSVLAIEASLMILAVTMVVFTIVQYKKHKGDDFI